MAIEGFDYQNFAKVLTDQAGELTPAHFNEFQKNYVVNTILNFATLAGEALYNDTATHFTAEQAMLVTQIIAEWSFHKSVDVIKSGIMPEQWDGIMQKIAFTIFEVAKKGIQGDVPQDQLLLIVEHQVKKAYEEALSELQQNGIINEELMNRASHQSNIDDMMQQIQEDKQQAEESCGMDYTTSASDSKILKLASVALLLKQVSQDKVQTILNKFNPEDANMVIQYMQMPDLEQKVDKSIALKCLQEIKTNLPEPKKINPNKILLKLNNIFKEKDPKKIETAILKERPNVKKFIATARDGEYFPLPSKVANIIAQHLEECVQ